MTQMTHTARRNVVRVSRNIGDVVNARGVTIPIEGRLRDYCDRYARVQPVVVFEVFKAAVEAGKLEDEIDAAAVCAAVEKVFANYVITQMAAFYTEARYGFMHGAYLTGTLKDQEHSPIVMCVEAAGQPPLNAKNADLMTPSIWFPTTLMSGRFPGVPERMGENTVDLYSRDLVGEEAFLSEAVYGSLPVAAANRFLAQMQANLPAKARK